MVSLDEQSRKEILLAREVTMGFAQDFMTVKADILYHTIGSNLHLGLLGLTFCDFAEFRSGMQPRELKSSPRGPEFHSLSLDHPFSVFAGVMTPRHALSSTGENVFSPTGGIAASDLKRPSRRPDAAQPRDRNHPPAFGARQPDATDAAGIQISSPVFRTWKNGRYP